MIVMVHVKARQEQQVSASAPWKNKFAEGIGDWERTPDIYKGKV
jgi:hypothetical protein